jgi:hypothetical protein
MSEDIREPEMTALETALAGLAPRPACIDRDRLMFLAGQRSAARRGWLWPCASAALASAATLLSVLLLYRPEPRIVRVPSPAVQPSQQAASVLAVNDERWNEQIKGLQLRNEVLSRGVDALPEPPQADWREEPLSIDSLLQ